MRLMNPLNFINSYIQIKSCNHKHIIWLTEKDLEMNFLIIKIKLLDY